MCPNYQLSCQICGHEFENIQGYDAPNAKCEKCGGMTRKVICAVRSIWRCPIDTPGHRPMVESLVKKNRATGEVTERKIDYSDKRNIDRSGC